MIVASLFTGGIALLLLVQKTVSRIEGYIDGCVSRGDKLREDEPFGFYPGKVWLWLIFKVTFLPVLLVNFWHYHLKGRHNLEKAWRLYQQEDYQVVFLLNHVSSADVWMPQVILWLNGFRTLAEKLFVYVIGLKFFNRHPQFSLAIRCKDRIPIVPPTMIPKKRPKSSDKEGSRFFLEQLRFARRVNDAAKEAISEKMVEGRWPFLAPEGTRQRDGQMNEPHEGFISLFDGNSKILFLPAPLAGTRDMWIPEEPIRTIKWGAEVSLCVGDPITFPDLMQEAKQKASLYGISVNRAAVNLLMYALAAELQKHGYADICGIYNTPWERRDWGRKPDEETESKLEEGQVTLVGAT